MNDHLPMFDDPPPETTPDTPKKPRRKPVKRRKAKRAQRDRKAAVVAPVVSPVPKKRRAVRKPRVTNGHAGGRYTRAQYQAIATLMDMSVKERMAVLEIVKGLTK